MGLRSYQIDLIDELRAELQNHRRVLTVLPTGAGKTHTFCTIAQLSTYRNHNVLILVHRSELIEQTSRRLQAMDVPHGVIAPRHPVTHAQVQVASIHSAARRLSAFPWSPNLVIVDEAHHCAARSWRQVLDGYPNAHVIGWTATPQRLDGKGLRESFDALIEGPGVRRLIGAGALSNYRLYAPPTGADLSGLAKRAGDYRAEQIEERMSTDKVLYAAVDNYRRFAPARRAIAFCTTIKHAELVVKAFAAAEIPACSVDGTLSAGDRADRLDQFKSGAVRVLVSVDLISEGFDVPACDCAILLRPTASVSVYLQQVGRALRPSDTEAIILDCAGNSATHGLPCEPRAWSLDGIAPKSRSELQAVAIRVCPACYSVHRPAAICPYCGHAHKTTEKSPPREVQAELSEVDLKRAAAEERAEQKQRRSEVGKARTLEELLQIAKERGYKPGWAYSVMKSRKK
jgi:superfamily II DNA or RNA helicase